MESSTTVIVLDLLIPVPEAIYLIDKAYVDFQALYRINTVGAFFVTGAKSNMNYHIIEENLNIDPRTELQSDKTIVIKGPKSKILYPKPLRLVEYHDFDKDVKLVFLD